MAVFIQSTRRTPRYRPLLKTTGTMREAASATALAAFDKAFNALIQQESGGRPGAVGPSTQWGNALGMTQMLPATAKEMAGKLGLPYSEALLRGTSPQAAAYQKALGEAYFREALQKTGNLTDALHYYHGGPNRKMWGPKTRGYAQSVLARMK